jgi:hypothetical protein
MQPVSRGLDRLGVVFDDDRLVANAGLLLPATLAAKLGIEATANEVIDLGQAAGAFRPGRKLLTLVHGILAGGDCISDCDVLRAGASDVVTGHRVMAPSTIGTFLRAFTFGHVRQLDKVFDVTLGRAWAAGAGPGGGSLVIDIDSTICEVCGYKKQGASYGYTKVLGYHPLLAVRAETGEVLGCRFRAGRANTGRGVIRFVNELIARVRRAGATGPITLRADSGFWSDKLIRRLGALGVRYSVSVRRTPTIGAAIDAIAETAWQAVLGYPDHSGVAEVAESAYRGGRLIVRRVRHYDHRGRLPLEWRHFGFVTDRAGTPVALDEDHRNHAIVELAIRDLKEGAGWNHCPSGRFNANAAWLVAGALAHNLLRWTARLGGNETGLATAKTFRRQLISLPGRLATSARRVTLHLPTDWPYQDYFGTALGRLRALPAGT